MMSDDNNNDSLIQRAQEQGALFPQEVVDEAYLPLEKDGVFTAERLFKQRPLTYRQIVVLSAHNIGQIRIGKTLKVSPSTVRAVQRREGETIDIVKTALSEKFADVAGLAVEELRERLERNPGAIDTKDLVLLSGVATDKTLLLAGQATARLEVSSVNVGADDFREFVERMGGVAADVGVNAREAGGAGGTPGGAGGTPGGAGGTPGGVQGAPGGGKGVADGPAGPTIDVPPVAGDEGEKGEGDSESPDSTT